jgi:hypothetical protein
MPPKKKEKGAAAAKAALNLSVLQRVDPQITRIEASTAHATLYKLENGTVRRGAIFGGLLKSLPHRPLHATLAIYGEWFLGVVHVTRG